MENTRQNDIPITNLNAYHSDWLQTFIKVYQQLQGDNLESLHQIYHPEVTFIDPLHRTTGITALLQSFQYSYSNIIQCNFVIHHAFETQNQAAIYWSMIFSHRQINNKQPIEVKGHSHLKVQDYLIIFHQDYFDVGAMIYEHIPLVGFVIKNQTTSNL